MPRVKLLKVYKKEEVNDDYYSQISFEFHDFSKCENIDDKKLDLLRDAVTWHNQNDSSDYSLCLLVEYDIEPQKLINPTIDEYLAAQKVAKLAREKMQKEYQRKETERKAKVEAKKKEKELKKLQELAAKFGKTI